MSHPEVTIDYTSGSAADPTTFAVTNPNLNPARWITPYGAGSIVMIDAGGVSRTYTVTGSEVLAGEWSQFVSTTCARIRVGTSSPAPQPFPFPSALNLAGGAAAVVGILPASQAQDWADSGTINTVGFTVSPNTMYPINFQAASAIIAFPKITAALNGLSVGLINMGTGATTCILTPSGTDSLGVVAAGVTSATSVGPASLKAQRYTPNLTTGQWTPGI